LIRDLARHFGTEDTFCRTPCAVFFGEAGKTVNDPYFDGAGPARTGCTQCGACMVGCRVGAKNTLVKNYLWFAEKRGAVVLPEHEVTDVAPLGGVSEFLCVRLGRLVHGGGRRLRRTTDAVGKSVPHITRQPS
jgi:cholesterol oxidase